MAIIIQGFSSANKVPGFYGETKYGAGPIALGSIQLVLLLCGLKSSAGSMTADTQIVDIFSEDDANTYAGPGSELARMAYAAIGSSVSKGLKIKAISPAAAGGAAQAELTITIAGTITPGVGALVFWIGGVRVDVALNSTHSTATLIAAAIVAAVNANTKLHCTAANVNGVVTLTMKCATVRGDQCIVFQDISEAPAGMTSTLGGNGDAKTGGGLTFGDGGGVEDLTNVLATLYAGRYHRIAPAQNDASSLADWETQIDDKAGPTEGRMEHVIVAGNGTLAASTSLGQTTLNDERFQFLWYENSETVPSEIAAAFAAVRTETEQEMPNSGYDGYVLTMVKGQREPADFANHNEFQSALDNSVTPIGTNDLGEAYIVRSITTRSLDGSNPDYRTLDTAEAVVPDAVRDVLRLKWESDFVVNNPHVQNDPPSGAPEPPAGVATPIRWKREVTESLLELQTLKWLTSVESNLPQAEYNATAKRIMSAVPTIPLPLQHQIGVSVRQLNAA